MVVYIAYAIFIFLFIVIYHYHTISKKLKSFLCKGRKTIKNPRVTRDVSLAMMVNGVFSLLNANGLYGIFGYLILTLIGVMGIIVSNEKIED